MQIAECRMSEAQVQLPRSHGPPWERKAARRRAARLAAVAEGAPASGASGFPRRSVGASIQEDVFMRILHAWWHLPSFFVGVFFTGTAILCAMPNENAGLIIRLAASGFCLLIALLSFWMSLAVGAYKKKAHEFKRKIREERI